MYDLYAIPSHNYPAYYLLIYKKEATFECVYARTEIYIPQVPGAIKMYPFSEAKKAEQHPAKVGKIIVGFGAAPDNLIRKLELIKAHFPTGFFYEKNEIMIDGAFQAIRFFNKGIPEAEFIYNDIAKVEFPDRNEDPEDLLNNMYQYISENIIIGE